MVLAAALSSVRLPEALLLCIDGLLYVILATLIAINRGDDVFGAMVSYLAICVVVNASRHIAARGAACNQDATSEGQLRRLPAAIATSEARQSRPRSAWPWIPVAALTTAALAHLITVAKGAESGLGAVVRLLALVGAEAHFIVSRVHGDCRGGKPSPTLFVLAVHALGAICGTPAAISISLHRLIIVWTYFFTGLRKMYCVGPRWCDGKNLQIMLGIQGLYHDHSRHGWNFFLARYRRLCCFASVAVVALQMTLPLCLTTGEPIARWIGFGLAMSFHASNHILWRINFFVAWCPSLLALVAPFEQLTAQALVGAAFDARALAPTLFTLLYFAMQFGHALDLATEKLLAAFRRGLDCHDRHEEASPLHKIALSVVWLLEMHCLGDYYS